jgi:hypothetical protein
MNKKDRGKRDSVFSWNDQSANVRTVTWETGKKLNIKMYEKNWKTVKSLVTVRGRGKKSLQSTRYVRQLRYSLDMDTPENTDQEESEEKRQIAREV